MRCEACRRTAPTRYVTFYQNIGLLVIRLPSWIQGNLCKSCIHQYFWKMTLISLVAGWWGIISLFTNIYFIGNNVVQYLMSLSLPAGGDEYVAESPRAVNRLSPVSAERIDRFRLEIEESCRTGEDLNVLTERISDQAAVPKEQVMLYILERLKE